MSARLRSLCILMALICMVGCQSTPHGERAPDPEGHLIDPQDARALGYRLHWVTSLGVPLDQHLSDAVVLGDVLVTVEEPSSLVSELALRDGALRWRRIVGERLETLYTPTRFEDRILVNSSSTIYQLDAATGTLLELNDLEAPVSHGPAYHDGALIFGGVNGRIFAKSVKRGYADWEYDLTQNVQATPVVERDLVFAADSNGVYACLGALTGKARWRSQTYGRVSAQPAANRFTFFLACEDQNLYALDQVTGGQRWIYRAPTPLTTSPIVLGNTVYQFVDTVGLVALDANTGKERWKLDMDAKPISLDDDLLLLHEANSLIVVDALTGQIIRQVPVPPLYKVIKLRDASLLLISPNGQVLNLIPEKQ